MEEVNSMEINRTVEEDMDSIVVVIKVVVVVILHLEDSIPTDLNVKCVES